MFSRVWTDQLALTEGLMRASIGPSLNLAVEALMPVTNPLESLGVAFSRREHASASSLIYSLSCERVSGWPPLRASPRQGP